MECFGVYRNEIDGRLDCHFYRPEYTKRDRKIKSISNKQLGDYIISISGGATPDIKQSRKYYTDANKGIPFLRVQNVTSEGLNIDDVKYINKETHEGLLKRSQVKEFNVLTKITGVGRMGVSSVAPKGFIGNINQHLVVLETESEKVSKVLATFLNSDVGEKLAKKRSTGGTRPALDYKALTSIPIVFKSEIVMIIDSAYEIKKQKETEAQQLIDTINDYVLKELGIKLPELKDKRCYVVNADEVNNNRCDAYYYQPKFEEVEEALENGRYNVVRFDVLIKNIKNGVEIRKYSEEGYRYLRVTDLGEFGINDIDPRFVSVEKIPEKILLGNNSFLISRSGSLGLVSVVEEKIKDAILSSHIFKVDLDYSMVLPKYLESYFRSTVGQIQFFRNNNGGIVPEINQVALKSLLVILPPINIQNNIANEVKARMQKAVQLQKEAKEVLEEAKERVERIILGEEEI